MTAFAARDRVTVAWSPPGTTERITTTGIVISVAALPVALRHTMPPQAYDVLTADGTVLHGVAAEALELIKGDGK